MDKNRGIKTWQLDDGIGDTFILAFELLGGGYHAGQPRGPIPRYRQYHCPIDSPDHVACNRFIVPVHGTSVRPVRPVSKERMVKTCRKRPGNLTRNTDS